MTATTTMNDFTVLSKLGTTIINQLLNEGTGAFSEVFRVRRKTDNLEYALKKVCSITATNALKSQRIYLLIIVIYSRSNLESSMIRKRRTPSMRSGYLHPLSIQTSLLTRRLSLRR